MARKASKQELDFIAGWKSILANQRMERAKYVCEVGLKKNGWKIEKIADVLGLGRDAASELVDYYWVSRGAKAAAKNTAGAGFSLAGSAKGLKIALRDYSGDFDKSEVEREAKKIEKTYQMSKTLAERAAKAKLSGEALWEDELIDDDGKLLVNDDRDRRHRPSNHDAVKEAKKLGMPKAYDEWKKQFSTYTSNVRAFVSFLRRSNPDMMRSSAHARQLDGLITSLQEQTERFEAALQEKSK